MKKSEFPAVLVLSAIREDRPTGKRVVCFADGKVLHNDHEVTLRRDLFEAMVERGGLPYDYVLVHVDDAEEAVADITATLQAQVNGDEEVSTPPPPEDPPTKEDHVQDDTTPRPDRQVVMVVRYQGTGSEVIPTGSWDGATAELVEWHNGRSDVAPDSNVKRLRDWLLDRGYQPDYPQWQWLDRGHGPRRRREVYRLNGAGHSHYDTIDHAALRRFAEENPLPRLSDEERLALYKGKALAGDEHFEACPDCPLVQDCPNGWGACDRKAELARKRRRDMDRPTSSKNPAVHVFWNH